MPKLIHNFRNVDWELLRTHLATVQWDQLLQPYVGDCNALWTVFRDIVADLYQEYIPLVRVTGKINSLWINNRIKAMIRTMKRKWSVYKRHKTSNLLREYRQYCKQVKQTVFDERKKV